MFTESLNVYKMIILTYIFFFTSTHCETLILKTANFTLFVY